MRRVTLAVLTLILVGQASFVQAGTLFTSGPFGARSASDILIDVEANSFTLSAGDTVTGVDFAAWLVPGFTITSVTWDILSGPTCCVTYASGTATPAQTFLFTDPNPGAPSNGFEIDKEQFAIPAWVAPTTGTYWLALTSGVARNGAGGVQPAFWDENGNANLAWTSFGGGPGAFLTAGFTFDITGTPAQRLGTTADVPEPGSMVLAGLGVVGVSILRRRRASS